MAIFHLCAKMIGRSAGRSATAAAAYRAGCRIEDARTGEVFDYTRRSGVREAFILAPADAPAWVANRAALWNRAEAAEKRKDAQVAREVEISLPSELPHEERRRLVVEFIQSEFVVQGMVADVAMHAPGREGDKRNEHAHILLTLRALATDDFGQKNRDWNRTELLERWRARWAAMVNERLAAAGLDSRIDHRSLEAQGIADRPPTEHLGPAASALERRGIDTERGEVAALLREREQVLIDLADIRRQRQEHEELAAMQTWELRHLAEPPTGVADRMEADPRLMISRAERDSAKQRVEDLKREMLNAKRAQARAEADSLVWRRRHRLRAWLHDQRILRASALVTLARAETEAWRDQERIQPLGMTAIKSARNMEHKYESLCSSVEEEHAHVYETDIRRSRAAAAEIARREREAAAAPRLQPRGPVPTPRQDELRSAPRP